VTMHSIDLARTGERDPRHLRDNALLYLSRSALRRRPL
jgi:hypothetical protein